MFYKFFCICVAFLAGTFFYGHPAAGILFAPFGWIAGKAISLNRLLRAELQFLPSTFQERFLCEDFRKNSTRLELQVSQEIFRKTALSYSKKKEEVILVEEAKKRIEEVKKHGKRAKGRGELIRYLSGRRLRPVEAIQAKCYECCGYCADGVQPCTIRECPLWPYSQFKVNSSD